MYPIQVYHTENSFSQILTFFSDGNKMQHDDVIWSIINKSFCQVNFSLYYIILSKKTRSKNSILLFDDIFFMTCREEL
jgi:hypothetical protein